VERAPSGADSRAAGDGRGAGRGVIELEGQELVVVEIGHTDTHDTTVLHVPVIRLVVAGDAAYNGVHQLLAETDPQKRREWIAALEKMESLRPRAVIAGHKRPGNEDSPRIIEETRQYIRDFDGIAETATTARELYDQMLKLHPLRMNVNAGLGGRDGSFPGLPDRPLHHPMGAMKNISGKTGPAAVIRTNIRMGARTTPTRTPKTHFQVSCDSLMGSTPPRSDTGARESAECVVWPLSAGCACESLRPPFLGEALHLLNIAGEDVECAGCLHIGSRC
jgi:Metallo-beta-lactamase superfamily